MSHDEKEWRVAVRCPHDKIFWVPIRIFMDPEVSGYGCGCPETKGVSNPVPSSETPADRKRLERKLLRQFKRELKNL